MKNKSSIKIVIQQSVSLLDREAKKSIPYLLLLFLTQSFLDVVGISLVGAFLLLIINFNEVASKLPTFSKDIFLQYSHNEIISIIGLLLIVAFVFKAYWGIYTQKKIVSFTSQFTARFKLRLMKGYQNAANLFHLKENSAYLVNRISLIDSFSNNVVSMSLNLISSAFLFVSVIFCLLLVHPIVTFILTAMFIGIFFLYESVVKNKIGELGKVLAKSGGEINKIVLHSMGGLKEIRVLGREGFFIKKMESVVEKYADAYAAFSALQLIPRYAVESGASVFLVALILGALLVGVSPLNIIPTIGIFSAASIRLLPTVSQLIGQFSQLRASVYVVDLLYNEINKVEHQYKIDLQEQQAQKRRKFSQLILKAVSFKYPETMQNALSRISLTIMQGQSVGLIGPSGAGKSTLVNIILGILPPTSGEVLMNSASIHHLRDWLNTFAYIPQTIFLLDDTVKRNIALGIDDADIDEKKIDQVIAQSQLIDVVTGLPNGVDTLIGENGIRLSGGQRQRVALARALYFEREIIIMDEATSSLDHETENEVINSIKQLKGFKTLIIIAHRLTTIQHCDMIYKLDKGGIMSFGSYDQVVREKDERLVG